MPEDAGMPLPPPLEIQNCVLLVRTNFSNDEDWTSLRAAVEEPTEEGFLAGVELVDDPAYSGLSAEALRNLLPKPHRGPYFFFVADRSAMEASDHPILVVPVPYPEPEFASLNETPRPEFRVVASKLWSVENNLSIANMDWRDFAGAAQEGVFRGFPEPR
jgi:hypothetical protein